MLVSCQQKTFLYVSHKSNVQYEVEFTFHSNGSMRVDTTH